jgi:hypothetical protein
MIGRRTLTGDEMWQYIGRDDHWTLTHGCKQGIWGHTGGSAVDGLPRGQVPEAQLESENLELVVGVEGAGEGVPVDGFDGGVGPEEMVVHVGLHEAKSMLAPDGGGEFAGDSHAAQGELNLGRGKEWDVGVCGGEC